MEEENNFLDDITADVTAGKTEWKAAELNPDTYAESEENTIQMQSIDYGKFEGTLNFNVSVKIPELRNASDEMKVANNFLGSFGQEDVNKQSGMNTIKGITNPEIGSIIYLDSVDIIVYPSTPYTFKEGYYKVLKSSSYGSSEIYVILSISTENGVEHGYLEYLGKSYSV